MTANPEGFTTQNRVGQLLGYDQELMVDAAKACNDKYEIAILNKSTPPLLLVPQTYGKKDSLFLIHDLIAGCNHLRVKKLHFTHFGFIQSHDATKDFVRILEIFLNPLIELSLRELIWEIDIRGLKALEDAYHEVRIRFRLLEDKPTMIFSRKSRNSYF